MSRAERKLWENARTLDDLGELMARWLEGDLASRPGYRANCGPDPETTDLIPVLAALNRAGYVTTDSQPGESGWGARGTLWQQRAAVAGVADDATLTRIRQAAAGTDLVVIARRTPRTRRLPLRMPRPQPWGVAVTASTCGLVATSFGGQLDYGDVEVCFAEVGDEAFDAVLAAWQVAVVDPEWTRNDLLWPALAAHRRGCAAGVLRAGGAS